jgi:hypothetical protein
MKQDNIAVLSGAGLGILIGTCIGLSISEVVGVVLAALTSLLAAYFGLKPPAEQSTPSRGQLIIVTSFSFSCVIAIFLSVYLRANNVLSPSSNEIMEDIRAVGFTETEAKKIFLFRQYGMSASGEQNISPSRLREAEHTVLFNADAVYNAFKELQRSNFPSTEEQLNGFRIRQGKYKAFADTLSSNVKDEHDQQAILRATLNLLLQDK